MRLIKIVFINLLVVIPKLVFSQRQIDWVSAKDLLYTNNMSLKQSFLKEKIAINNVNIARGNLYPNLTFTANNQHTMGLVFDPVSGKLITGNQWSNYATGNLGTTVVLFQGGQKLLALDVERANWGIAEIETEKLLQELELQLLAVFTQTLINHDLWQASKSQRLLSAEQVKQEETLMDVGKRTLIDLAQAKAKFANDNLNTVTTKNAYELSMLKIKQILDISESEDIQLFLPKELEQIPLITSFDQRSDLYVKSIDRQLDLQNLKIKLARTNYFPTLVFNGSYGTNYSSQRQNIHTGKVITFWDQLNQNRTLYGNLSLTMPIFDGFRTKNTIYSEKLAAKSLLYEKEKKIVERRQIHTQAIIEYQAAQEELKAIQASYEANKINYEALNERYKVGKSSSIDLYKAMTEYNISEYKLITSRYQLFYKIVSLQIIEKK
ncbi:MULTISPECIES: TolC family protein [Sphingobacterium]|uniref:TolC family protein n=1 Tax=Sphingobacterium TaxID=28453 RepID=UPI0025796900|nr:MULTISPECIES: TolC family protein [Sphingobacterium]